MRKQAASIGSATSDPVKDSATTAPIPLPAIANKPAPGQTGPKGLGPRTTYSRSNTGTPPVPDAGAASQKGMPPRGMESLPSKTAEVSMTDSMMTRPTLQDLVKQAMAGTISKSEISAEATRQLITQRDDNGYEEKTASARAPEHIPTQYVEKLADALGYLADTFEKQSEDVTPGNGPGALEVTQATSSEKNIDAGEGGQAVSSMQPPKNPATQAEQVQSGKANTGLETNDDMSHGEQPVEPVKNEKASIGPSTGDKTVTASAQQMFEQNLARLSKVGSASSPIVDRIRAESAKLAEDANNPASISSGSSTPPEASASEQAVPSQPSDVSKQEKLVGSNDAAINYTKRDAKADPKSDMGDLLTEPAQSASTDKVLQKVLDHTNEAGAKISSVASDLHKTAAARILLSKLAEQVNGEKKDKNAKNANGKKEKESQLGGNSSTPTVSQPSFSG